MASGPATESILGLDIGVTSVGWCLIEYRQGKPERIRALGSRIFPAGVAGTTLDIQTGRDSSRNADRRAARQMRRQLWRTRRRMQKLHRILVRHGLLPDPGTYSSEAIDRAFKALDSSLASTDPARSDRRAASLIQYRIRARALDVPLRAHELGRALYHLAQRRGFLSNRKAQRTEEDDGVVKAGINALNEAMVASGSRTVGEYFAALDPETARIRGRWLGRNEMVRAEFEAIRASQAPHHTDLGVEAWDEICDAIFRQRPLRDQSHLIGRCSLEPDKVRCPMAHPEAQLFRILQSVNHLRIAEIEHGQEVAERALTVEERSRLIDGLKNASHLTVTQAKKLLGLSPRSSRFSIERGGETKILGDVSSSRLAAVLGDRWEACSQDERGRLIEDLLDYESEMALQRRLVRRWKITRDEAASLCEVALERTRARFGLEAIRRLTPYLLQGHSITEAKIAAYPEQAGADAPWDLVPPVRPDRIWRAHCSQGRPYNGLELRNPAVERSLAEVRRIVNAIVRRWGKPDFIRIELARDLKKPRSERKDASKRMREQEQRRGDALARLVEEGFGHVAARNARSDVEKVLLWEECGGVCPYTGASISFESLFGPAPRFEVEHIVPFSRSLEDGFGNKTLCAVDENRNRKRNRTPYEAYSGTGGWEQILARVRQFSGPAARRKLRLFMSEQAGEDVFGEFVERQLNDTRYAARLAGDYLGLLYGGQVDSGGVRRIQVSAGGATAIMRRKLGLEGVLGGGEKNRKDHRHHAVDAIAIGLTGPREVQQIAAASQSAVDSGAAAHRLVIPAPWERFSEEVRSHLDNLVVSHRADRRLSGPMHQATNYSRPILDCRGRVVGGCRHLRRPVAALSPGDVENIVDPIVRGAVQDALQRRGAGDPKVAFKSDEHLPTMTHPDGRVVPIRRVRVRVGRTVETVGVGPTERHVAPGSNHHMAVVETRENGVRTCLEFIVVTMLEAYRRRSRGEPIVQRYWGAGKSLVCTLRSGDLVLLKLDSDLVPSVVSSVSEGVFEFKAHSDARPATELRKAGRAGGRLKLTTGQLRDAFQGKLDIRPLGEVHRAHD
jgi:CRISPR-associated endonuclease Csn1